MTKPGDQLFVIICKRLKVRYLTLREIVPILILYNNHISIEPFERLSSPILAIAVYSLLSVHDYLVLRHSNQLTYLLLNWQESFVYLMEQTPIDRKGERGYRRHLVEQVQFIL